MAPPTVPLVQLHSSSESEVQVRPSVVPTSPPGTKPQDPIRILLTGYGPFQTHTVNPSFEIVSGLDLSPFIGQAEIFVYPEPVRVAYRTVRSLLPRIFASHPNFDYVIHLGVAKLSTGFFKLEQGAHRDGYEKVDVDGIRGCDLEKSVEEGWEDWKEQQTHIATSIDVEELAREVTKKVKVLITLIYKTDRELDALLTILILAHPAVNVDTSNDAGRYLCEYIFYSSLAHFNAHRRVLFLHVPAGLEEEDIAQGRAVLAEIIWTIIRLHHA
ncbi:Hypothetical protein MELLADRAFT_37974 [Melampsora larici-populina 98AG31]|uniref:Peptidase C15, pyroglutamyl peptidase I-like protein n=1 Tax=Melampsora larici-populina (strain 98AG31 / pathotype 3-4-7) TaxID=747676 RepID=F4RVW9_MELLP|nr:Hypothetical protein MELLADRAFT_37974 [Melampsora larici-populina 98AG31]EGG03431.1 Hypothetical protein MELLADRAFT_37974 [Melampsora larici-populina 98AG31]